MLTICSSDIYL